MTKIFVDTNIFLHFYNSHLDKLETLSEVLKLKRHIMVSRLSLDEFLRNRESVLRQIKTSVQDIRVIQYQTSIIKDFDEIKEIFAISRKVAELVSKIVFKIDTYINDPAKDPVFKTVLQLHDDVIDYDTNLIYTARRRKMVGNPPTTEKKSTVCDELHWEIILKFAKSDIILVTRDNGFLNNVSFLGREFSQKTGFKLVITQNLTEAMTMVGEVPSDELKQVDNVPIIVEYGYITEGAKFIAFQDDIIVFEAGGQLRKVRNYFGALRELCSNCQHFGPWSGSRCLTCGQMECCE